MLIGLAGLGACATAPAPTQHDAPDAPRPQNVLLIVLDDVSPGLIGAYDEYFASIGRPSQRPANTPAIDALLARQGMLFTRAWTAPKCTPSRAQILTGLHDYRIGVGQIINSKAPRGLPGLSMDAELLPQRLAQAPQRYATAALGKWHLTGVGQLRDAPLAPLGEPPGRWFQHYAGALFNLGEDPKAPPESTGYRTWSKFYASRLVDDENPCAPGEPPCTVVEHAETIHGYPTVDTTDDALRMAATLPQPWFLYVAYNAIHEPLHHVDFDVPLASCADYTPTRSCDHSSNDPAAKARCMMEVLDSQIGRLLCGVDLSNTTVILIGDNGMPQKAFLPPYPRKHGKGSMYQGGVEAALIVRSPLLAPELVGGRCDALAHGLDLFATVADIAGAPTTSPDSISLVPYLRGETRSARSELFSERFQPNFTPDPNGWLPEGFEGARHDQALSDGRFKLIRHWRRVRGEPPRPREEFFDLLEGGKPDGSTTPPTPRPDWTERHNLLVDPDPMSPEAAAALAKLRARLDAAYPSVVR